MNDKTNEPSVNILLVDDQPARLLSYETILSELGQNLVRAHSGIEALQMMMKNEFAVVLLDVSMPGMDGFETASLIHDHPRFEKTPIIFVTGVHITELDRLKGYKLGAVDYVSIPVVPEILRSKVAVLVELHLKRRELQKLNATLAQANARLAQANTELQTEKNRELEGLNSNLKRANADLAQANSALQSEIRERARIEQALKEADKQKNEFLAMLAHELRNPLAPILNATQLMRRHSSAHPQLNWSREIIERQLSALTRLVDDLLDVSRITRGKINVERAPLSLHDVVERAVETLRPVLAERQQQLDVDMPGEPIRVFGDLIRLTQVLGNVLNNASKYTDAGGRIALEVRAAGEEARICVRDTGIGMAPELLPSVFELFTQLDRAENRSRGGLGIGLALVRRLMELHGGRVEARSEGLGQGSEFTLCLPLLGENSIEVKSPHAAAAANPSTGVTTRQILMADDNQDALESLAMLLRLSGNEVHTAVDGAQALRMAEQQRPQVVLLDIGMPKLSGYEVAQQIRAHDWGREMFLVALTGWGQDNDRRRSKEAGFNSHLVKPLDVEVLLELLAKLPARDSAAA